MKEITFEIEEKDGYAFWDILLGGEKIGSAEIDTSDGSAYIERIDVKESFQRNGYGTTTLNYLSGFYGEIYLAPDNEDAKRLYERLGEDVSHIDPWAYVDQGYGVYKI